MDLKITLPFLAPLILYSSTPSKSRKKKHPNLFYILYLDRKRKIQYWKHFHAKFDYFYLPGRFFASWKSVNVKKINFCYWHNNELQYLMKNSMETKLEKKVDFIAQNFDFNPLKTFYPLNTCKCKIKSVFYFHSGKLQ